MARILVIDDSPEIRKLLRCVLENLGHKVLDAPNGKDGLALQRQTPAELIITDIFMPEMDGNELIMDIGEEFPEVEVIVISGGGNVENVNFFELAENLGAVKSFKKPFVLDELINTVNICLNQKTISEIVR